MNILQEKQVNKRNLCKIWQSLCFFRIALLYSPIGNGMAVTHNNVDYIDGGSLENGKDGGKFRFASHNGDSVYQIIGTDPSLRRTGHPDI